MLATLFRSKKDRDSARDRASPFTSPFSDANTSSPLRHRYEDRRRHRPSVYDAAEDGEHSHSGVQGHLEGEDDGEAADDEGNDDEGHDDEHGEDEEDAPLLPIFEASHLDNIPVYNLAHAIRLLIVPRCETTLTWDQLRSPQVSQFVVKPIQRDIILSHFSRATLYALMANCLQFNKESQENPGNSGTCKTRAMVCELLAIRLLKEYSIRELIDALSYDFYPLQGLENDPALASPPYQPADAPTAMKYHARAARISTLEVAIRAQAKRLLAHPMVVQQLEAIWAGNIVFHSAADSAHRPQTKTSPKQHRGYGTIDSRVPGIRIAAEQSPERKLRQVSPQATAPLRRTVTIYDPSDASLFKLSRLRVPRYRSFLSTCSLAVLLGLFVAVLHSRHVRISTLEILFWLWSAGFMLDEVVGFNEQGFSLYILSFWNSFDVGILLVLICYYCLRIYGLLVADGDKMAIAYLAYDVLAFNAVLLFPRLFSILDHYRYFSQLLIAFRMMAQDLAAILILILISCSGFFVAFTLAFGNKGFGGKHVAYALFQIIMGFTPAAWEQWDNYNIMGKLTLVLFLCITHFLVVTILITVLTNSMMKVLAEAHDEHQFVFAVNTISMVKSDALFSYIAPTNIIAWVLTPSIYIVPFRQYVKLNRTVIKVTHAPILFCVFIFEKTVLKRSMYDRTDLVEQRGRRGSRTKDSAGPLGIFQRPKRIREPSVATFRKDETLNEVFRHTYRESASRLASPAVPPTGRDVQRSRDRRRTSNVVNTWMDAMGLDGRAGPPIEKDDAVIDSLEHRRTRRTPSRFTRRARNMTNTSVFAVSDPEDFRSLRDPRSLANIREEQIRSPRKYPKLSRKTTDETEGLLTTEADEQSGDGDADQSRDAKTSDDGRSGVFPHEKDSKSSSRSKPPFNPSRALPRTPEDRAAPFPDFDSSPVNRPPTQVRLPKHHDRNPSTNTILFNPVTGMALGAEGSLGSSTASPGRPITARPSNRTTALPSPSGRRTPKRAAPQASSYKDDGGARDTAARNGTGARPILPSRANFRSTPNLAGLLALRHAHDDDDDDDLGSRVVSRAPDLLSDLGDNKAVGGGAGFLGGAIPASFATHMAFTSARPSGGSGGGTRTPGGRSSGPGGGGGTARQTEDQRRVGRLMLARMNTLEEGFRKVLKEVKDWRREEVAEKEGRSRERGSSAPKREKRDKEREKEKGKAVLGKRRAAKEWVDDGGDDGLSVEKGSSV